jgi:hypothetical protein
MPIILDFCIFLEIYLQTLELIVAVRTVHGNILLNPFKTRKSLGLSIPCIFYGALSSNGFSSKNRLAIKNGVNLKGSY